MDLPSVTPVKELTRKFVLEANERHVLHTLTPKLLRRKIEAELELVQGDLDSSELKDAVKEAIAATMAEVGEKAETEAAPKSPRKNAAKGKKRSSDAASSESAPKKKSRIAQKKDDKTTDKTTKGKGRASKQAVSPEPKSTKDEGRTDDESQSTKKPRRKTINEGSDYSESEEMVIIKSDSAKPPSKVDAVMSDAVEELSALAKKDDDKAGYKSESELSVLIDEEPPKKRRNSKTKKDNSSASSSGSKKSTKSRKAEHLTKDEETIKKLKSLILACGVRKVWSKVFKGVDTPSQQIKMLKEILHELGMTGRMSLDQAKAIKAKRELAQELQDVQEFEKAVTKSGRQPQASEHQATDESDEDEENENPKQRRTKMNAAQSISAFLGDQSSDED